MTTAERIDPASEAGEQLPPLPLPLERRATAREPIEGRAMLNVHEPGACAHLSPVELADASAGGLGVISTEPLEPGRVFELYRGDVSMPRVVGTVARCAPIAGGAYRVGLRFAAARAA